MRPGIDLALLLPVLMLAMLGPMRLADPQLIDIRSRNAAPKRAIIAISRGVFSAMAWAMLAATCLGFVGLGHPLMWQILAL